MHTKGRPLSAELDTAATNLTNAVVEVVGVARDREATLAAREAEWAEREVELTGRVSGLQGEIARLEQEVTDLRAALVTATGSATACVPGDCMTGGWAADAVAALTRAPSDGDVPFALAPGR